MADQPESGGAVTSEGQTPPQGAEVVGLESFYRASRFLSSILDIDELLRAILEEGLDAVNGTRGFVALVNRSTGELELRITAGEGWDRTPSRSIKITDEPGNGISIRVVCSGVPYVTGDVRRDPHYVMFFPDVRSEIAVPLVNRDGRVIGVINVESDDIDAFSQRDLQYLVALANQAAVSISVANHRARERALIEVGNELASATDMDELLAHVVRRARELLRADDCSVFELNEETGRLILRGSGRMLAGEIGKLTYKLGEGLTGWVAEHAKAARVADVREDPRWRGLYPELPLEAIEAFMAVPIFHRSQLWGVLRVIRRKPASSILRNDFTERDEILLTTLARQVGAAITQQTLVSRQLQMERMAAWGEMSARSAHMIGNKVFALKGQLNELEYLAKGPSFSKEVVLDVVERAKNGVFRLEEILTEFRDFLLATHLHRKPTELNDLVRSTVRESSPHDGAVAIWVETAPELPRVAADTTKLRRALSELLENAVNHQPEGGEIRVVTGLWGEQEQDRYPQVPFRLSTEGQAAVRVEVIDRGAGVPEENKGRLFTPFFTTRSRGMGLGLSIVKGIIDAHQGAIWEVGRDGQGAHFVIVLPALRPDDEPEGQEEQPDE
jgi:signal transduction histidine kinase